MAWLQRGDCRAVAARLRFHEEHQTRATAMRIGLSMPLPAYTIDPALCPDFLSVGGLAIKRSAASIRALALLDLAITPTPAHFFTHLTRRLATTYSRPAPPLSLLNASASARRRRTAMRIFTHFARWRGGKGAWRAAYEKRCDLHPTFSPLVVPAGTALLPALAHLLASDKGPGKSRLVPCLRSSSS
jgi:hypothetical protein